jgi:hypothetical protein
LNDDGEGVCRNDNRQLPDGSPSRDAITLGNQIATREWWSKGAHELDLLTSQVVVREAGIGDPTAAQERLKILATIPKLVATDGALMLARQLVEDGALPEKAAEDALHIAIAVVNAVDFQVTWNCRHIANPETRKRIDQCCRLAGYEPVIICTPLELLGE